jgi:hypothetical protein
MLVIAHHFIQNPEEFWKIAQQTIPSLPQNLKLHSVFPSEDLKTGTCVWESSGVSEVQDFLDKALGHVSKNVCYEVKEEMAIGLPHKTMEETLS